MFRVPQTRQSLILELGRHSDEAWAEFLLVYEDAIFRFCRAMGLQEADARDATQDVLAAVHQRVPSWNRDGSAGSFRAWLFRVARNISVDAIHDRARATAARGGSEAELVLAAIPASAESQQEAFDAEVQRSLLDWALGLTRGEVREVTWRAFQLTAVQGLPAEVVATELGISVGSVYTAKCRVVARIRERVAQVSCEHLAFCDSNAKSPDRPGPRNQDKP